MTWVKICGVTNAEDAQVAAAAGADALGFVFYERSPRKVDVAQVKEVIRDLPKGLELVGVFVDTRPSLIIDIARAAGLNAIQYHQTNLFEPLAQVETQREGLTAVCAEDLKMYFALPAGRFIWESSGLRAPFGIFLDSWTRDQPGGTGKTFDWAEAAPLVAEMSKDVNVVVAGGLNPENVASAIRTLHPFGVDVSSGVEARPGKKDPGKVRAFLKAVREADKTA